MEAVLFLVCEHFGYAIIIAGVMGILTRVGNMLVRAFSGKEDWF